MFCKCSKHQNDELKPSSTDFGGRIDRPLQCSQEPPHLSLVFEPVAHLFTGRIVAHHIRAPQLGEMNADCGNMPSDQLGQFAGRARAAGFEQNDNLIDNRITQQSAEPRLAVALLVHRADVRKTAHAVNCTF
jgi:hypothetical protein